MRIILHTELNAEDNAMLQALYSRSAASVTDHLQKLEQTGSSKFMSQYYLGYGHGSIGDCGNETIYLEGISMLAAKAIEDNQLFVGQECSSRYIDFSTQPFYDPAPANSQESGRVANLYTKFRKFYVESLEPLKADLRTRFPIKEGEKESVYEKAIAARAFDILRGFLPAGATTNVAWTARLSDASRHLISLMHHPLEEVRRLSHVTYYRLWDKYPNSFHQEYACLVEYESYEWEGKLRRLEGDEKYEYMSQLEHFYTDFYHGEKFTKVFGEDPINYTDITVDGDFREIAEEWPGFKNRVKRTPLPKHSPAARRTMTISGIVDFGSFRDLQRHRNMFCNMPMLTGEMGLHPWYFENLTEELRREAYILLNEVETVYEELLKTISKAELQYILPMGFCVGYAVRCSVSQGVYLAELRSGKTVHATLRPHAQLIGAALEEIEVPVFYDKDESDWTIRRGEQDIVEKPVEV